MNSLGNLLQQVNNNFEESPYEINNGCCEDWANMAMELLNENNIAVAIWETVFGLADTVHCFIQSDGKFFDAECLEGVEDYMQLPIFVKAKRPQPVVWIDGTEPKVKEYNVSEEALIEAGYYKNKN